MVKRMLAWVLGAVLLIAPTAHAQWASLYDEEPYNLGYDGLSELSMLLELDAPAHELLAALHLELIQGEAAMRKQAREALQTRIESGEDIGWREGIEISLELTEGFERVGERFFDDVKLIVTPEQAPLIEHMRRRTKMGRWLDGVGSEFSELAAMPLKLLADRDLVSDDRLRELILELADREERVAAQFQRTYDAVFELQNIGQKIDYDFDEAGPEIMAEAGKAFKKGIEEVTRLREMNKDFAEQVMTLLDEQQREAFERHWWDANYEDVQDELLPERAVRTLLNDEQTGEELKQRAEEIRAVFEGRMKTARKMARVAKYRTDLDLDFSLLLNGGEPDTRLYDDALERLSGIAESYASALKGLMTKDQRIRYGLDIDE